MAKRKVSQQIKETAELYRLAQAQKMLDLFEAFNGRPASTVKELAEWAASPKGKMILAFHLDESGKIDSLLERIRKNPARTSAEGEIMTPIAALAIRRRKGSRSHSHERHLKKKEAAN